MRVSFRAVALLGAVAAVALVATAAFLLVRSGRDTAERRLVSLTTQGFTLQPGGFSVAYAFVAKNNSHSHALTNVHFEITFYDPNGEQVAYRDGFLNFLPGQEVAIGSAKHGLLVPVERLEMEVTLTGGTLEEPPSIREGFALRPLDGTVLRWENSLMAQRSIFNPFEERIRFYVSVVLYNEDGAILAGDSIVSDVHGWDLIQGTSFVFHDLGDEPITATYYAMIVEPGMAAIEAREQEARSHVQPPLTPRWAPAELPAADFAGERAYPYAGQTEGGSDSPTWSVYVVDGDGEPRLIHETRRRIQPSWSTGGDSIVATVSTSVEDPSREEGKAHREGRAVLNPSVFQGEEVHVPGSPPIASPTGDMEVHFATQANLIRLFLRDAAGNVRRMEHDWFQWQFGGWSPDGQYLVLWIIESIDPNLPQGLISITRKDGYYHLVPVAGGPSIVVNLPNTNSPPGFTWSPDGRRMAFVGRQDAHIFDVPTQTLRRLTIGAGYVHTVPTWSEDGSLLHVGGDVIDVQHGGIVARVEEPTDVRDSVLSGDGHHLLTFGEPNIRTGTTTIYATDLRSGEVRTFELRGFLGSGAWLVDGKVAVVRSGGGGLMSYSLLNVEDGSVLALMAVGERHAELAPSPDRTLMLLGGNSLRVFDASGRLLREIQGATGLAFSHVTWSPDGKSFLYILGPRLAGN